MRPQLGSPIRLATAIVVAFTLTSPVRAQTASQRTEKVDPPIVALAFSPDGEQLIAASQAGWSAYSWPTCRRLWLAPFDGETPHDIAFSPTDDFVAIGGGIPGEEGTVEIFRWPVQFDSQTQIARPDRLLSIDQPFDSVMDIKWRNKDQVAAASLDREVFLFAVDTGKQLQRLVGHSRGVRAIAILPDRQTLVSGSIDHSLRVWNLQNGQLIRSLDLHTRPVVDLAVRPQAGHSLSQGLPMVASASKDRTIRFWQPTIGRMVRFVRLDSNPLAIAWSADGLRLYAVCDDGGVRSVDPTTVQVEQTAAKGEQWIYCIAVHPHDGTLAIGGSNGKIDRVIFDTSR